MNDQIIPGKNCLNYFKNYQDIEAQYTSKLIRNWTIKKMDYQIRLEKAKNTALYRRITDLLNKPEYATFKRIEARDKYKKPEEKPEILSWIDALHLTNEVMISPELNNEIRNDAVLIQEYVIPYTRGNRADFVIAKDNKICILEYSYEVSSFLKKAQQAFTYKNILQQFLSKSIEIVSYTFSYTSETEEDDSKLQEQIRKAVTFLNQYFDPAQAINELQALKDFS